MSLQFTICAIVIVIQFGTIKCTTYIDHVITPKSNNFRLYGATIDQIISQDQLTKLQMQPDGNLCLYTRTSTTNAWNFKWGSNTDTGSNYVASLQWDGNFIVYNSSYKAQWNSATWHSGSDAPNILVVSNGGYAYIVNRKNEVIWQINTANTITPSLTSLDQDCTFPVLSIDHTNNQNGKYFNFDATTVDIILDRTDWTVTNFTVYNSRTAQISKVIFWRSINGGSVGNAHGRKQPMSQAVDGNWQLNDMLTLIGLDHNCYTLSPTASPTSNTGSPTSNTNSPTANTGSPTSTTTVPSFMPTDLPTVSPTANTAQPTGTPTRQPSITPTIPPTNMPSIPPTITPTNVPTKTPTFRPTDIPTHAPVKDGQAIDTTRGQSVYTSDGASANIGKNESGSNDKMLIIIGLAAVLVLLSCAFIVCIICFWKRKNKKVDFEAKNGVEMNSIDMGRVTSVSSNGLQTNTITSDTNGEVDGMDCITGALPPETNDADGNNTPTDEQNELFLETVEYEAPNGVTAGQTAGAYGNDAVENNMENTDTDTDEDDAQIYGKPQDNNVTQGL